MTVEPDRFGFYINIETESEGLRGLCSHEQFNQCSGNHEYFTVHTSDTVEETTERVLQQSRKWGSTHDAFECVEFDAGDTDDEGVNEQFQGELEMAQAEAAELAIARRLIVETAVETVTYPGHLQAWIEADRIARGEDQDD
ncbi:hypothetical protein [Corynebacterium sputi]|uniref:hypothetical protein n=1 Tax=Corynebacterium sputi TaxID=489915 RepID=UPI00047E1743|nr:hypothetical protein [Corynebacterium sputi]